MEQKKKRIASAFYFAADMGVSTYDAVALVISEKWNPASFRVCRICCDLVCVIIGVLLFLCAGEPLSDIGAVVGVGTIITAFFMGR